MNINRFALNYYLMYGHMPRGQTIIEGGIREYDRDWNYIFTEDITNESQAKQKILEQLNKSIREKVKGKKVGAFLSGGLDSSTVVALASKHTDITSFSVKFDKEDFDETDKAKIVADRFSKEHHVFELTAEKIRELIPELVDVYGPFGDTSMIPTYFAFKEAKKFNLDLFLMGDGGDETLGGYNSYKHYSIISYQQLLPRFVSSLIHPFSYAFGTKANTFFEIGTLPWNQRYGRLMSRLSKEEFRLLIGEKPNRYYEEYVRDIFESNFISEAQRIDLGHYLPDDGIVKVETAAKAIGINTYSPFIEDDFIKLACKIHPKLKIQKRYGKYLLRRAMEGILPRVIIYQDKQGFGVPLKHYFKNELRDLVDKWVFDYKQDFFETEWLKSIMDKEWEKDYSKLIWSMMIFNMWYEKNK